jgi:hypothetical protein
MVTWIAVYAVYAGAGLFDIAAVPNILCSEKPAVGAIVNGMFNSMFPVCKFRSARYKS